MKRIIIFSILFLLIPASAQPVVKLSHHTIPENPPAGYFVISIDISNSGSNARDLSLYLSENEDGFYLIDPYSGEKTSSILLSFGELSTGDTSAQIKAYAEKSGLYTIKVSLSYKNESGESYRMNGVIGVAVYELPFIYAGDVVELRPGDSRVVEIPLKNLGGSIESAVITLSSDFLTSKPAIVGHWDGGSTKIVEMEVKADDNAVAGTYSTTIIVNYRNDFGERGVLEVPVVVKITSPPKVRVKVNTIPEKVYVDSDFTLAVEVLAKNSKLENLAVSLSGFEGENEKFIGTLEVGERRLVNFSLKAPLKSGNYEVTLLLKAENFSQSFYTPLYISDYGKVSIDLAGVYTSPQRIVAGDDFKLSIQVENSGKQDVKAVAVNLILPDGLEGRKSYFIGSLSSGDSATATFEMRGLKSGNHRVVAEITYMDQTFEKHRVEREFEVYVFSTDHTGTIIGMLTLFAIISALLWLKIRRKG